MKRRTKNQDKTYILALDESGTGSLKSIDEDFPVLVLTGILMEQRNYTRLALALGQLKKKFYKELKSILASTNFHVIATVIDKEKYISKFGKISTDPYQMALTSIMERAITFTDSPDGAARIYTVIESRGPKEDQTVATRYQQLISSGSLKISRERFNTHFYPGIKFRAKIDNEIGIEVADICAYSIARFILGHEADSIFTAIKSKIATNNSGNPIGYGIKILP